MKLLQEADLDNKFNAQLDKIQDAVDKLKVIIGEMKKPGSMTKPVPTQLMGLRYAAEDLKALWEQAK